MGDQIVNIWGKIVEICTYQKRNFVKFLIILFFVKKELMVKPGLESFFACSRPVRTIVICLCHVKETVIYAIGTNLSEGR